MKHFLGYTIIAVSSVISMVHGQEALPKPSAKVEIQQLVVNGFRHPGIGLSKEILENARAQILERREPWHSGFQRLAAHPSSSKFVSCRAEAGKNTGKPEVDAFDSRSIEGRLKQDAEKAKHQALMYLFTGDEVFRANAMHIVRVWSKMDPLKYRNYREAHIHASYPVQDLILAAELLRYTRTDQAQLAWVEDDTRQFTENFVKPAIHTFLDQNGWFMNQNGYPLAAAMAGDIFMNHRESYAKRVEWFTVNSSAPNRGWSSSITHLARLVHTHALTGERVDEPMVQLMEMGRDQAHAGGDLEIYQNTARQMNAQGTKVDPVTGRISEAANAVGPYEFLDGRILAAADHFCRFMLGYETPWIPAPYDIGPDGEIRKIYSRIADNYRGRIRGLDFWDMHFYETYKKGVKVSEKAPYYHEAFTKRIVSSLTDWIHIPAGVAGEGARVPSVEQEPGTVEIEERSTLFDSSATVLREDGVGFVRIKPREGGTRIALLSCDTDRRVIGMRIRSTGAAEIEMSGLEKVCLLPDTGGEWRQVIYTLGEHERFIDIVFFTVRGASGIQVDLDQLQRKPAVLPTGPEFAGGAGELKHVAYVGAPVHLDFSVKNPGKRIRVYSKDLPKHARLDERTGAFHWEPTQEGEFEFRVMAADDFTTVPRKVRIDVAADRRSALNRIAGFYDPARPYLKAGDRRYKDAYERVADWMSHPVEQVFYQGLAGLQAALAELQLVTPCLKDGSMDFPKVVVASEIGAQIASLADGNDDTFPVHSLAMDFNYIFDFGEGFRFTATAFEIEGRLNFENRTLDTAFFGSDDSRKWTQLTPELVVLPVEMQRVEVDARQRAVQFRYLKIQKMSRKSAGLFEPSELRIHGQRHEVD